MRLHAGTFIVAAVLGGSPAVAQEQVRAPSSSARTQSVAVFPDVTPGPPRSASFEDVKPPPPPDPSLELLSTNPYEAQLAAAQAAQNLYGDDFANPYVDELRFANPYTDELRFQNPYSQRPAVATSVGFANPYSAMLQTPSDGRSRGINEVDLGSPYRGIAATPVVVTPAAPARPGTLFIEAGPAFYGSVFVDGVGVVHGAGLPVLPGLHTVTVYPVNGTPFSVSVDVPQGSSRHVRVGP